MNPIQISIRPLKRLFNPRLLVGAIALAGTLSASAVEKTFRYYQFKPLKISGGSGVNIQFSEFDFYRGGAPLNINNKNGSGINVVTATAVGLPGEAPVDANEGPPSVLFDGLTAPKFVRRGALNPGQELVFDFGATPPAIDSYSFTSSVDATGFIRTPETWVLSGSNDSTTWTPIDLLADAIPAIENLKVYGPFMLPEAPKPWISSYGIQAGSPAIILNGQSATLNWTTQYATDAQIFEPGDLGITVPTSGSRAVTPPANTTSTYTLTATRNGTPASSTALVRTVVGGAKTYQYVRYQITQRRGTFAATRMVQLAEFEFYNGDSTVPANKVLIQSATNDGGDNLNADQVVEKLFDGTLSGNLSKWLDANNRPVVFDFGSPKTFDRYLFVTAEDAPDRDPVQWVLEGSNDLEVWEQLENVDFNYPTSTVRNASSSGIPLPGSSIRPRIGYFTADSPKLISGEALTLRYSSYLATSVQLVSSNPNETLPTNLPLLGTLQVSPTVDTTYTLTATGTNGTSQPMMVSVQVVADPGGDEIAFESFENAASAFVFAGTTQPTITASNSASPNRLRLTEDAGGRLGTAWYLKKLDGRDGFEATFGLSMNKLAPSADPFADGISFVIQNSPEGAFDPGTGETGVTQNALNICFRTFGTPEVEVRSGTEVLSATNASGTPGVQLYGVPGVNPGDAENFNTLASLASDPPYNIRVVYSAGDLDVYIDGIAVIQNVDVDLTEIGATDASGKSFFGFSGRTGGYSQANDITNWNVKFGDFSAVPTFSSVKHIFYELFGLDMVWNANAGNTYEVQKSFDLQTWLPLDGQGPIDGLDGQIGLYISLGSEIENAEKAFFRVMETPLE